MAYRMRYIVLIFFILCLPLNLGAEEKKLLLVRKHWGTVKLTGNLKYAPNYQTGTDADIELTVETIPYDKEAMKNRSVKFWWGQDGATPNYVTKGISLLIGKKKIEIPSKSYADLGDVHIPNGVNIYKKEEFIIIKISGGDGAGSYRAHLICKDNKLLSREIYLEEFPERAPHKLNFK